MDADSVLEGLAPTMGVVKKLNYSHDAMVDLIIARPGISQGQLAATFGYTQAWVSNVMASDAFRSRLAARREELVDPALLASVEERFEGLVLQSLDRLQEELAKPACPANVILKAVELGARGVGVGGFGVSKVILPVASPPDRLEKLKDRLLILSGKGETVEGQIVLEG